MSLNVNDHSSHHLTDSGNTHMEVSEQEI